jgi:flagellar motility protein MotE (MotC chaperone)
MADLIASLADEKKNALKEAKEELERRKARLLRLEENVLRRYKALRMLQEELSSAMKRNQNEDDAPPEDSATATERKLARAQEIRKLAKSFESMKPAAAAQVIEVMDDELVVDVLRVVNPRKSGKILGALEPKTAARVSELMTNMRRRK